MASTNLYLLVLSIVSMFQRLLPPVEYGNTCLASRTVSLIKGGQSKSCARQNEPFPNGFGSAKCSDSFAFNETVPCYGDSLMEPI